MGSGILKPETMQWLRRESQRGEGQPGPRNWRPGRDERTRRQDVQWIAGNDRSLLGSRGQRQGAGDLARA